MKFRKLRIAFSVACAIVCVLLLVLWVRSYYCRDYLTWSGPTKCLIIESLRGTTSVTYWNIPVPYGQLRDGWDLSTDPASEVNDSFDSSVRSIRGFRGERHANGLFVGIPDWSLVLLTATLAAAPWIPRRFSLRTLLIATTLVAVMLGVVVYASR